MNKYILAIMVVLTTSTLFSRKLRIAHSFKNRLVVYEDNKFAEIIDPGTRKTIIIDDNKTILGAHTLTNYGHKGELSFRIVIQPGTKNLEINEKDFLQKPDNDLIRIEKIGLD